MIFFIQYYIIINYSGDEKMATKKILIVGGVAGGASAAVRLRRLDEHAQIIIFERGPHVSYANCGLPYHIGEIITEREKLLVQTPEKLRERFNLDVRILTEVKAINREQKTLVVQDLTNNNEYQESYDILILSPGAAPLRPPIPGINLSNIFTLRNIPDTEAIKSYIDQHHPIHATVVGAGYVGIEMAENLAHRGIKVTVVELAKQVMAPLDIEMAAFVHQHLKSKNVELYLEDGVKSFEKVTDLSTKITLQSGRQFKTNLVLLGIGVKPERTLAEKAGLNIGKSGGISVNDSLQTSDPNIYAIGDAIEVVDLVNRNAALIPLAGPANKQGRIVANHIYGQKDTFEGTQGTSIAKIFDLTIATTGNNEKLLKKFNIPYLKTYIHAGSHAGYYPGSIPISIKLLFAPQTGKILGAQAVGYDGVDKRIDVLSFALRIGATVYDLEKWEHAYAPPYSSAKDPINILGFTATNILKGDMPVIYWDEMDHLDFNKQFLLDVRTELEFKLGAIKGAVNIPLDELRFRLKELPKSKEIIIYCQVGQRGYYATRILLLEGFKVRNLSGGYKSYEITKIKQSNEDIFDNLAVKVDDVIHATNTTWSTEPVKTSIQVDACGLQCPGPIMKIADNINTINPGELIEVKASDPGFYTDVQAWAKQTNNFVVKLDQEKGVITALVKKGLPPADQPLLGAYPKDKTMVIFSGDLDKAIAAFIIANGAAAMGRRTTLFFTFWGLNILRKSPGPKIKKKFMEKIFAKMMPAGADALKLSQMNMGGVGTKMIKNIMKKKNVPSLPELIKSALSHGVKIIACQMTMELLGIQRDELIDGIELGGVATFLAATDESNTSLFI
jgi:NADPH-dependent 2,4-dienoyl-CoA reductase/sulfur reductase-like enzyme/peroxiredoxin family protein/TusA-related sulfurtransferase/rhodanese-related sulfurtransferase